MIFFPRKWSSFLLSFLYVSKSNFTTVNTYLCTFLFLVYLNFVFVDSMIVRGKKCFGHTLIQGHSIFREEIMNSQPILFLAPSIVIKINRNPCNIWQQIRMDGWMVG